MTPGEKRAARFRKFLCSLDPTLPPGRYSCIKVGGETVPLTNRPDFKRPTFTRPSFQRPDFKRGDK